MLSEKGQDKMKSKEILAKIRELSNEEKKKITRAILEALPEWFGILEAREEYILDSVGKDFFCAMEKDKVVGFLYLK